MGLDFHRYGQGGEGEWGLLQVFVIARSAALRRGTLCPSCYSLLSWLTSCHRQHRTESAPLKSVFQLKLTKKLI